MFNRFKSPLILATALAATALLAVLALGSGGSTSDPASKSAPRSAAPHAGAHQKPQFARTLAVYTDKEPPASVHPERMRALLTKGRLPAGVVEATVLTDENCEADETGLSRCRNELGLPDGRKLAVRHPHRMHDVPCMTPGETVRLGRAADV